KPVAHLAGFRQGLSISATGQWHRGTPSAVGYTRGKYPGPYTKAKDCPRPLQHACQCRDLFQLMSLENPFEARYDEFALERDSNKFLGDSSFWKHYEKIPVRFVYKAGSIEYRNLKLMLLEMIFYLSLVACLTAFLYNHIDASLEYQARQQQEQYWGQCSSEDQSVGCRIEKVKDVTSFWEWYRESLVPLAFNVVGDQNLVQQAVIQSRSTDDDASSAAGEYPSLTPAVTPPEGWLDGMLAVEASTPTEAVTNDTSLDLELLGLTTTTAIPTATASTTTPATELILEPSVPRVWPEHAATLFVLNEESIAWRPRYVGDTKTNILLGPIRIRQVAVTPQRACAVQDDLASVHSVCFGQWSSSDQYKFKIAKTGTPDRVKDAYMSARWSLLRLSSCTTGQMAAKERDPTGGSHHRQLFG
ncbi:hypothetical protein FOZ63_003727, partial [Perkinsus olseni]